MENTSEKKSGGAPNWKRVIPAACLGIPLFWVGCLALVFITTSVAFKSFGPYKQAMIIVKGNADAAEELGSPIKAGFLPGYFQLNSPAGDVEMSFPVSGPKDSAKLYVVANKQQGKWKLRTLELVLKRSGPGIDLLKNR